MPHANPAVDVQRLRESVEAFALVLSALAPDAFLRPVTQWSPRDVTAHLIGWNTYTLAGCRDILRGVAPFYLADAAHDFRNVNAAAVQRYSSTDKDALLSQLRTSADALLGYLSTRSADDWGRDTGLREPDGRPLLARNDVVALIEEYIGHTQEVAAWIQR
jgi:hypothetical protein